MTVLLLCLVLAAAYANGANDVSKGVGTLVGSGRATYRRGLAWGTIWTVAGAVAGVLVPAGLAITFSTGLLETTPAELHRFLLAVSAGVFGWVIFASRTGLPVSTTHAMAGSLVGAALAVGGSSAIRWPLLGMTVVAPLALSPLASGLLAYVLHAVGARSMSAASRYCVCLGERQIAIVPIAASSAAVTAALGTSSSRRIVMGRSDECTGDTALSGVRVTDAAHWVTSAALSFARGMNDNPKIVALGIGAAATAGIASGAVFLAGAAVMGAGGYLSGRRVTTTLAEKVTDIDPLEGLSASFVAAVLVLLASFIALPVSTTHVATGAIIGAGLGDGRRAIRWNTVAAVALGWLVTLPVAGLIAAATWGALELSH